ncbi:MAG: hypothetical protein JW822_05180 [Spirochaetales bacterium]|nr:hypothetical protein [Spirochaetales bacterium]
METFFPKYKQFRSSAVLLICANLVPPAGVLFFECVFFPAHYAGMLVFIKTVIDLIAHLRERIKAANA